ncbi:hypothetical protein Tco_1253095 [Tanacetum coccineum]
MEEDKMDTKVGEEPKMGSDREDLDVVYQLVMNRFQDEMPEGFDRVLWGDLMVLSTEADAEIELESEIDSTMALELIRFIKKLLAELEPEEKG